MSQTVSVRVSCLKRYAALDCLERPTRALFALIALRAEQGEAAPFIQQAPEGIACLMGTTVRLAVDALRHLESCGLISIAETEHGALRMKFIRPPVEVHSDAR